MHRSTAALLLALISTLLLAAGCGGDDEAAKDSYTSGMRSAARDLDRASSASSNLPADATAEQRAAALDEQRELTRSAFERASDLDPPADAEKAHDRFVKALGEYADLLDELAEAGGDAAREGAVYAEVAPVAKRLSAASADLEDAGYDFGVK